MHQITAARIILYLFIYSFIGWCCESVYCSIGQRRLVNRGFLNGPYCPVYGFGALLIIAFAYPYSGSPALVFLITMLACGVLEYFTGWMLESIFQTRWWDYSNRRFNIKGRVCLLNLLLFGILGLALVYLIHPFVISILEYLSPLAEKIISLAAVIILYCDLMYTLAQITNLRDRLHRIQAALTTLEVYSSEYAWFDRRDLEGSLARLRSICEADADNRAAAEILNALDRQSVKKSRGRRLLRAFPDARFKGLEEALESLKQRWQEAKKRSLTSKKRD